MPSFATAFMDVPQDMDVPQETPVEKPIKSDPIAKVTDKVKWDEKLGRETPLQFELRVYLAAIIPDIVYDAVNNSMRMHHEDIMASLAEKRRQPTLRFSTRDSLNSKIQYENEGEPGEVSKSPSMFYKATLKRAGSDLYSSRKSLAERQGGTFEQKTQSKLSGTIESQPNGFHHRASRVGIFLQPVFAAISMIAICINSILIGIEADAPVAEKSSVEWVTEWMVALNIYFITEVTLKMLWLGPKFCTGREDRCWNFVDLILGIQCFVDLFFTQVAVSAQSLRLVRLVRLLRSLRLLRYANQLREFRKMVYSMVVSAQTLMWACVMLAFVIYCFAAFFSTAVQAMGEDQDLDEDINKYFGTISAAMLSLWLSITAGMNWVYFINPLRERDPWLAVVFVAYIALSILGVMNIVTSVFVESAMTSTKHFRDLLQQEQSRVRGLYAKHLKDIFVSIDADSSGMISMEELKTFLADPGLDLSQYLEALELNAEDAKALFKLLDRDSSGAIDVEEFCDGCLRLKGEAKSFDINCLVYEGKRTQAKLDQIIIGFDAVLRQNLVGWDCRGSTSRGHGDSSEHVDRSSWGSTCTAPKSPAETDCS